MPYKNPEDHRKRTKERNAARRTLWFKQNGPCHMCDSWEKLELDHIDPEAKVDHRVWGWSDFRREEELKKCQPLCYECHKKKTKTMYPIKHGTNRAYCIRGCRCGPCTEAHRVSVAKWRETTL